MNTNQLHTDNPELLHYTAGKLHITVLGGIKFTGLDRLKVTLKIINRDNAQKVFRHNVDLYNSIQTGQLVERAADYLDIPTTEVTETIDQLTTALEEYRAAHLESLKPKPQEVKQLTEAERKTAITFLKSPDLINRTQQAITQSGITGEETNSLVAYLIYTSRKRTIPLHLMCLGASGTGKTWLQEKVGELIPEEDKLEITTLTTNAFYYFGKEELKHKLLLIEDLDGAENVLYPLRELQSKRRISKTVTLKDSKGNMKTVTLNVEGPVCVSGCTTKEQLYEDNANRCILLYMDNSTEQDTRIMEYQSQLSAGHIDQLAQSHLKEQIKNVQRVLQPITVRNPYATYIKLPNAVFKPRRTMLLLLLFTETITYYHQYQRELKTDPHTNERYIETTIEDIQIAFLLLEDTMLKKSDELNHACRAFFEKLKAQLKEASVTTFYSKDIRGRLRVSATTFKRYINELLLTDYIRVVRGSRYKGFEYQVEQWHDMENLINGSQSLVNNILETIKEVDRSPSVGHNSSGLHKAQRTSKKQAVVQSNL